MIIRIVIFWLLTNVLVLLWYIRRGQILESTRESEHQKTEYRRHVRSKSAHHYLARPKRRA
ncbi:MAG: hypothetical protein ACRYHA_27785 [Janthinobacterium lividum]